MESFGLAPYDVVMLAILVVTTVLGAWKGMAWQLASLASLVLSYFVALNFSAQVAPWFGDQAPWNRFLAMLVLYLATSMAVWFAFRIVAGMIDRVKLKEFDRQMGALLGAAKGALFCVAITFFAVTLSEDTREIVMGTRSGYYISWAIEHADPVMPEEIHEVLGPYLHRLDAELEGSLDPAHTAGDPDHLWH